VNIRSYPSVAAPDASDASGVGDAPCLGRGTLRQTLAVIVPCFNEREALSQLFDRLKGAEALFPDHVRVHWCFVDDGSTDGTWASLCEYAQDRQNCTVVRHERNQGLAAAFLTGVAHTEAPVVGAIDADCTYDPSELPAMLNRMHADVAVVTASPYHPDGGVAGVEMWRLWVSKAASICYRSLARNKLHTYTSCFRLYRREALEGIHVRCRRFAGVAELLWQIDRRGGIVVEYPTILQKRKVGRSKLRLAPVIIEHLRLLSRCAWQRLVPARVPRAELFRGSEITCPVQAVTQRELPCRPSRDGNSHF
jgi:dolichol-phosphate mannosyltransferase